MRIVAGEFGGRAVKAPDERATRPTTDRVRESIFSSVYSRRPDLSGTRVLDAFAGSGALGLEALSRGAAACSFYEREPGAVAVLRENVASLGLGSPRAVVCPCDVGQEARTGLHGHGEPFGLVLLDPPYALEPPRVASFLSTLAENGDLADRCIVVYEHAAANAEKTLAAFDPFSEFEVTGQKKYGKIGVVYLRYVNAKE